LASDLWSRFMTSVVAVCLTLISPYMFKIVSSFFCWILRSSVSSQTERVDAGDRAPLLDGHAGSYGSVGANDSGEDRSRITGVSEHRALVRIRGGSQETSQSPHAESNGVNGQAMPDAQISEKDLDLLDMLEDSESSRDFVWRCMKYVARGGKKWTAVIALIIFVLFCVFVAWAIVVIVSAYIASDKIGLSSSQHCGIWQFDDNAGDEAAYRDDLYNRQKEERASQYARNCYNNPDPTDTLSCRIFYNQSIGFETKTQQSCPFPSSELCYKGLYSAITFDTGLVDASTIGINSRVTFKFRRRTKCSPLNMSEAYISKHREDADDTMFYYNYGSLDDTNYTFNTSGHPFEWLVPVYSAKWVVNPVLATTSI